MVDVVFLDFEWKPLSFLKRIKGSREVRIIFLIDEKLLTLSVELVAEKGWLGKHEIDSFVETLKRQLERKIETVSEEIRRVLEERKIHCEIVKRKGNMKEILLEMASKSKGKIYVFVKRRNPLWRVVKPILSEIAKKNKNIEVVDL
ncbi:hypothetical protein TRQ7_01630 [Thermotoga sp. RQ7]|jgi:polyhydroxyalkanoate synthesis regulator phasin|uniref:hypothetical protein n=1 Tax=Thermotoga sp. RQ7 TaxID=126738 RepID=UPI0005A36620|nr:hypothetical protein [Thermotoga sp. RQ7]AJG40173.1 hypothetical protein TRQ7_01630 [Thermotoga sp. RQ7]